MSSVLGPALMYWEQEVSFHARTHPPVKSSLTHMHANLDQHPPTKFYLALMHTNLDQGERASPKNKEIYLGISEFCGAKISQKRLCLDSDNLHLHFCNKHSGCIITAICRWWREETREFWLTGMGPSHASWGSSSKPESPVTSSFYLRPFSVLLPASRARIWGRGK